MLNYIPCEQSSIWSSNSLYAPTATWRCYELITFSYAGRWFGCTNNKWIVTYETFQHLFLLFLQKNIYFSSANKQIACHPIGLHHTSEKTYGTYLDRPHTKNWIIKLATLFLLRKQVHQQLYTGKVELELLGKLSRQLWAGAGAPSLRVRGGRTSSDARRPGSNALILQSQTVHRLLPEVSYRYGNRIHEQKL